MASFAARRTSPLTLTRTLRRLFPTSTSSTTTTNTTVTGRLYFNNASSSSNSLLHHKARAMTTAAAANNGSTPAQKPRHFLAISDLSQEELSNLVQRAAEVKAMIKTRKQLNYPLKNALARQTVAIMFSKRSTRTRISTEGAVVHLSGHPMFLGKEDIQLGVNESFLDTSKVISSMSSCMVARVGAHSDIVQLAQHSSVPVINALSDSYHPLQAVTDILTIKEAFPTHFSSATSNSTPLVLSWVGDANNVLYDLMTACGKSGISVKIATPKAYPVDLDMLEVARRAADEYGNGAVIEVGNDPLVAVRDADIIVTDTWISMGQESEKAMRLQQFSGYQVSHELASKGGAKPGWKFMHCLPRKPEEVTDEVMYDEKRSLVFTEAENRLYAAIAALEAFVVNEGKVCCAGKGIEPEGVVEGIEER